jgi:hypothetical protein
MQQIFFIFDARIVGRITAGGEAGLLGSPIFAAGIASHMAGLAGAVSLRNENVLSSLSQVSMVGA